MTRLARFAWWVLGYNIVVILWGAYVRASGSGAGCGGHWPLCNGAVIPQAASITTLVEFSHRVTSGLALLAVVALWWKVRRLLAASHPARRTATWSLVFMLTEAAVGAGLVLFQLVADNASMARALFMAVHLINTFLLVAAITLTAHFLDDGRPVSVAHSPFAVGGLVVGALGILMVGTSGAVSALGDTLYPSASLAQALASDLSTTSHLLIRLRVLHPALALTVAVGLVIGAHRFPLATDDARGRLAAGAVAATAVAQVVAGFVNVLLLAPIWMQIVHLLVADVLWIAFIVLAASTLAAAADGPAARANTRAAAD
jgi:heme A synthase